ncbi:hypothetical protein [Rhodococcus opacus]|uniref:Uncharacterized protein n=1 Tax=Rhodococcus opacus TaxID=37919 RepID=A0A2S8IR11_RHOOP|nr:hypothetical protein [Rhodococcus opacus]PQP17129.1 hypothetical protein C5613_35250 [Rhodococcus opacus]
MLWSARQRWTCPGWRTPTPNPDWVDDEVLLGYAALDGYTVMVLGFQGKQFQAEFDTVFTRAVEKVRGLT